MKTSGEWIDFTHNLADNLEHRANEKCATEIQKAKAYCEGYTQAIEDYASEMRRAFLENQGN